VLKVRPERRPFVEALAVRVAAELADGVLEHARASPAVASALASIYGSEGAVRSIGSLPRTAD
jgi:nicotinamide mononucleotide (NMN) deamidase PncC